MDVVAGVEIVILLRLARRLVPGFLIQALLLDEGQQMEEDSAKPGAVVDAVAGKEPKRRRHAFVRVVDVVRGEGELLEVVGALGPGGAGAHRLDGRDDQRQHDAEDGDDDEKFKKCKGPKALLRHHGRTCLVCFWWLMRFAARLRHCTASFRHLSRFRSLTTRELTTSELPFLLPREHTPRDN